MQIIDLLAAFPERAFTLTEIARAARINLASCRTVLSALTSRATWPRRAREDVHPGAGAGRRGRVSSKAALIARAKSSGGAVRELGIPVLLTTLIGDEVLALVSINDESGRGPACASANVFRLYAVGATTRVEFRGSHQRMDRAARAVQQ